ncbi:MAG TPA: flagellar protein [Firmicutes bacterium]|nr:flagellar protein [Candidatus Fermentithermobacillaceae bacterium]
MQLRVIDPRIDVRPPEQVRTGRPESRSARPSGKTFAEVLEEAKSSKQVTFSKHAEERLRMCADAIDAERLAKLQDAVETASAKGARSTLVLMKGIAFVVAPQTRTVITVIPEERMKENVFTSIDSAVLVEN